MHVYKAADVSVNATKQLHLNRQNNKSASAYWSFVLFFHVLWKWKLWNDQFLAGYERTSARFNFTSQFPIQFLERSACL